MFFSGGISCSHGCSITLSTDEVINTWLLPMLRLRDIYWNPASKRHAYARVMKTTLPSLSYNPTGIGWSENTHSSAYTTAPAYPRTDLEHLTPWVTFEADIHHAVTARMAAMNIFADTDYDVGVMPKKRKIVSSEEDVRSQAESQLHDLVEEVLKILGIDGWFQRPDSGNNQIIGEPDFSWLRYPTLHPKLVVRISLISVFVRSYIIAQDETGSPSRRLPWPFSA